ncbi:hypothetical protein SAMN02745181_3230 [Rubritalea squalenifaciens DSM 18772]|uniref:Uncharacterized protein n=1 Tax=Rubritalea squalenifaciens DSM 18772 TaxID=1123071 RepID=A0A1M6PLW3_9BACT|nr:hypothetical protein [Rubritalea squalenifaciens]SHK08910.1 hypothetical protein SAMN02745181_3230 [Rubritalea squalenifaciens DSM 18772]
MDGIWDDGEWISWDEINTHIYLQEKRSELELRGITDEKDVLEAIARDEDETTLVEELLHASVAYYRAHNRYLAPYSFFKKHVDSLSLNPKKLKYALSDSFEDFDNISPQYLFARDVELYKKGKFNHPRTTPPISYGWLLSFADRYYKEYEQHLPIYGEIGERYAADRFGFTQNPAQAQGSDGRMAKPGHEAQLANVLVEVKTITPIKSEPFVTVKRSGNWGVLAIVKIDPDMRIDGKLIKRSRLPKGDEPHMRIHWDDYSSDHLEISPEYQASPVT